MSSLVLELQRDALEASVTVLALLRKALVVARKLNIQEFQHWTQNELDGYPEGSELPQYRFMYGELKARNPVRGWIPIITPPEIYEFISKRPVHQPISQIESLIENTKNANSSLVTMPAGLDNLLRSYDYIPYEMAIHIDPSQAHGVLEAVRNVVLNWSLKLEEDGILGEGMTFSREEKQIAANHDYSRFIQINVEQTQMQNSSSESRANAETFNNDLGEANIGNFANKIQDNGQQVASNFSQNITQNVDEIMKTIASLREMAQKFPEVQREEAMVHLDDLQEDIITPEKQKPQRIKTRIVALLTIAGLVAGTADFVNNVLELSEKLGIPINISVPQIMQNLHTLSPHQPGNSPLSGQPPH